jgi:hypothetical protein
MAAGLVIAVPWSGAAELAPALAALTVCNVGLLRIKPLPPLYQSGVRYAREAVIHGRPKEVWLTIPLLYMRGFGDCEDLATARAAQLIVSGVKARAVAIPTSIGWHIVVRWPDGRIEDPSRQLGM